LISVTEKVDWPNYKPTIFLKSPRIAFCVRETFDLWQESAERIGPVSDFDAVEINQVKYCNAGNAALDDLPVAFALKAQALGLSSTEAVENNLERQMSRPPSLEPTSACMLARLAPVG
jgi:hypothetical protein